MRISLLIILNSFCFLALSQSPSITYTESQLEIQAAFIDAFAMKYKGDSDKAIKAFKNVLSIDQKHHPASYELAKIYHSQKNIEESIRYINKALKYDPENRDYLVFLSERYIDNTNWNKGITSLEKLVKLYPSERQFYGDLAYCQIKKGDSKKALETLNKLERLEGIDEYTSRKKFEIYKAWDDKENAEKELLKLIASDSENIRYLNNLAYFYSQTKQEEKALEIYSKILMIDPDHTDSNLAMMKKDGKENSAGAYLLSLKPLILNPGIDIDSKIKELTPYIESASPQMDLDKTKSLDNLLESLRNTHSKSPKAYALSADFYNRVLDEQNAIKFYEKTLSINDNIFSVWEQLLYTYLETKDYEKLVSRSENAMDLFPNQTIAYILHAKGLKELGRKDAAMDILMDAKLIAGRNQELLKQIEQLSNELK